MVFKHYSGYNFISRKEYVRVWAVLNIHIDRFTYEWMMHTKSVKVSVNSLDKSGINWFKNNLIFYKIHRQAFPVFS